MRGILFILFLSIFSVSGFSQNTQRPYWEMMDDPTVNFYDVKDAFYDYWNGKTIDKGKGWKQFKRWEYFMESRVYPSGDRSQLTRRFSEYQDLKRAYANRSVQGTWSYIGNTYVPTGGGGAGRVNCIAFHPNNADIILAGTPAGGIWRSTDGGNSWTSNTDDLPTLGISSIAFDPQNPSVVFAGTGDADGSDTYSVGVLKSTDGGITWNPTSLSYTIQQGYWISKVIVHPTNSNIVYACGNGGFYRSDDGGDTWTRTVTGAYKDMEIKPNDPDVIYVSRIGSFHRSTNGGLNFSQISSGLPNSLTIGRIAIAVTPADPDYVYLLCGDPTDNGFGGLYRSTDGGTTFSQRSDSPNILGWDTNGGDSGGQAWYDLAIAASPTNANDIFCGGVNIWRSTTGGSTWSISAHWYGGGGNPYVHADIHSLDYHPITGNLFAGTDGGVFRRSTSNNSWTDLSNNLEIGQLYKLGASATVEDLVISGWQDNGTNLHSPAWERVMGGDGMECIISHANPNIMYGSLYYGSISRSTNGGASFNNIVGSGGTGVDSEGEWVTPYIMNPNNANEMLIGKGQIYKSSNGGSSWTQLAGISGSGSQFVHLTYAPSNTDVIYAAKRSALFRTTDGGASFSAITAGIPAGSSAITGVAVAENNPDKAWVTLSGFSNGNKVFRTTNGGLGWINYSQGLPNVPVNCVVYQNGTNDGVYVGTDIGVFFRDASMSSWQYFSAGLPYTIVNELEIYYPTQKLRAATYGRGLWESDLYTNIQNDAGLIAALQPTGLICDQVISPIVVLENNGDNSIYSADVRFQTSGGSIQTFSWTGVMHPGERDTVQLPSLTFTAGNSTFTAWIISPNGGTDPFSGNDTVTTNFTGRPGSIEVNLTIQTDCYGSETGFEIRDLSSNLIYHIAQGTFTGTSSSPNNGGTLSTLSTCLDEGCYELIVTDSGNDGMSSSSSGCAPAGSYSLTDQYGNTLINYNDPVANFGSTNTHSFCATAEVTADFTASPSRICAGSSVNFFSNAEGNISNWTWSFNGGTPSTSSMENPVVTYTTPGTYEVSLTVSDGSSSDTKTITSFITVIPSPSVLSSIQHISCHGECTGSVAANVSGGSGSVLYEWSTGALTDSVHSLCAGTYSLIVIDSLGCRDTVFYAINEPSIISYNEVVNQANCGSSDGNTTITSAGGTGTLSIEWLDGSTDFTRTGLDIGTYYYVITDSLGCSINDSITVTNPNAPLLSISSTDELCGGDCNGSLTASASGGTGSLTLDWNNGWGNQNSYTDVCPGLYVLRVTDANNCATVDSVLILAGTTYPVANFTESDTVTDINISINFINLSTGATNYFWDFQDGSTSMLNSPTYTYTVAGNYNVMMVATKNGCADSSYQMIYVMDPNGLEERNPDLMSIYPNPSYELVNIQWQQGNFSQVEISDLTGRKVLQMNLSPLSNRLTLSTESYPEGIYFIRLVGDQEAVGRWVVRKQ